MNRTHTDLDKETAQWARTAELSDKLHSHTTARKSAVHIQVPRNKILKSTEMYLYAITVVKQIFLYSVYIILSA